MYNNNNVTVNISRDLRKKQRKQSNLVLIQLVNKL